MSLLATTSLCTLILVLSLPAAGDDGPLWKFSQLPVDARLAHAHDLDHPSKFLPAFRTRGEWEAHAAQVRRQLQVALGLWPMPPRDAIRPVIWGKIQRDGYTIEKVYFASRAGHYVAGNLYRPTGKPGPFPIVLTPHGHWENGRLMERKLDQVQTELESGAEQTREGAMYPLQARCVGLARLGCIVFIYDMVGIADSGPIPHGDGFRDVEGELRLQSSMGLQTWNSIRALDFVAALPDVDVKRIAVTGESGGGTQTLMLSAIDERVSVSVPCVMVSGNMQGGCVCENASLLRVDTNNIEIAALFAPKPLCAVAADDWTSDLETAGYPELQRIYGLYGATDDVLARHFSFPHNINQVSRELVYTWLNRHLALGVAEPIREAPFEPAPPRELSVFDAAHVRPADALEVKELRGAMSRESDARLEALRSDPEAFRETIRQALKVMLHEQAPARAMVATGSERVLPGDGFAAHQRIVSRPGESDVVPIVELARGEKPATRIAIWSDAKGAAGLFEPDGRTPTAAVKSLLQEGYSVIAAEVLGVGQSALPASATRPIIKDETKFAGYRYGYNRTLLADRAHDLLTVIAYAKMRAPKELAVIGIGRAGVWTLLAHALSNDPTQKAAIDLAGFDFDQVNQIDDQMLLPGAVKYGGVTALASLCTGGRTVLFNPPAHPLMPSAPLPGNVVKTNESSADEMVQRILK
jgi:dienelactone hydrolase